MRLAQRLARRLTLSVTPALAATVLATPSARAQYEGPQAEVETFVAPAGGGPLYLTRVSVSTFNFFSPAIAAVYAWNGSDLTGPSLFRTVLAPRFIPGISIMPDLPVTPGATYAFAVFLSGPGGSSFTVAPGELVQGGEAYRCREATGCITHRALIGDPDGQPRHYLGFAATFAAAPLVTPEPATLALTAAGVVVLGAVARRRPAR
jgi:hypothetical protein